MKVTLILIFVSISLATETAAQSRVYVSDADGTSFDQLVQVMLSHNKDLQAARESLRQAEARLTQARLKPNPSLDVTNATDALFSNEGDSAYSVTLAQPFELGGTRVRRSLVT